MSFFDSAMLDSSIRLPTDDFAIAPNFAVDDPSQSPFLNDYGTYTYPALSTTGSPYDVHTTNHDDNLIFFTPPPTANCSPVEVSKALPESPATSVDDSTESETPAPTKRKRPFKCPNSDCDRKFASKVSFQVLYPFAFSSNLLTSIL
jgi:hypothetical protein